MGPGSALYLGGQTITSKPTLRGINQSFHHYNQMSGRMDSGRKEILWLMLSESLVCGLWPHALGLSIVVVEVCGGGGFFFSDTSVQHL